MRKHSDDKKVRPAEPGGLLSTAGQFVTVSKARFEAVMKAAEHSALLGEKSKRIGGRISPALIARHNTKVWVMSDF